MAIAGNMLSCLKNAPLWEKSLGFKFAPKNVTILKKTQKVQLPPTKYGHKLLGLRFYSDNKTLGRAQDLRANGAWLSKLTE